MRAAGVSVIIVNMNSERWLRKCLHAINDVEGQLAVQVIVVDNGSTDRSLETATQLRPNAVLLPQANNVGYVRANNIGLMEATERYVLFLNPDAILHPESLQEMIRFMEATEQAGASSPQILSPDGTDQGTARSFPGVMSAIFGRRSIWTRWFPNNRWSKRYMVGWQRADEEPFEVEMLSSACLMMPTALAQHLEGMDEDFFLYWVDGVLCHRVLEAGRKVYCVPRAKVTHYEGHGGSTKTWRLRCRATILFHQEAYLAYVKVHHLPKMHPIRLFAGTALTTKAVLLMALQLLQPQRALSSVKK